MTHKVYDRLLKRYTELRTAYLNREAEAKSAIAFAQKTIQEDTAKMAQAIENEDHETYVSLNSEKNTLEANIKYYEGVLDKIYSNSGYDAEEVLSMYKEADRELLVLQSEYNKKIAEMIRPLVDYSSEMLTKIALLRVAKNSISLNLAKSKYATESMLLSYNGTPIMRDIANLIRNTSNNPNLWQDVPVSEDFSTERKKWI